MIINAYFTNNSIPQSGLIPTIKIIRVSDNSEIINTNMTELQDGLYYYDFTTYENGEDYSILCDGSATLQNEERYTYGSFGTDEVIKSDGFLV